ncbi:MAG: C25 family cysteine peptidase [Planctomycetota bacterium]|jgi:hypothetical protein
MKTKRLPCLLACSLLLAASAFASEAPDMLILSPKDLVKAAQALAIYRETKGHAVRVETLDGDEKAAERTPESLKAFVKKIAKEAGGRLRFLLLMGDAPGPGDPKGAFRIPPKILKARFRVAGRNNLKAYASDTWYGMLDDDLFPELAVGRLPADTEKEAASMVARIVAYEGNVDFGPWRKSLNIVAGMGGFGPLVDAFIESTFMKYMTEMLDPAYDVVFTYANPHSPYCFPPAGFSRKVVERINAGSLVTAYVGHGAPFAFDRFHWKRREYPIFRIVDAERVDVRRGAPIVVIIACSTGHFDHTKGDCISEVLLKRERGPVAVFSSTRISDPYANAIIGRELIPHLMTPAHATVGEAVLGVKKALIQAKGKEQEVLDRFAKLMMPPATLAPCREDHVHLYNLFGDPAMALQYPGVRVTVDAPKTAGFGGEIAVSFTLERPLRGKATLTLEAKRGVRLRPLNDVKGLSGDALIKAMTENWKRVNDLLLAKAQVAVNGRRFRADLRIPAGEFPAGPYELKVFVRGTDGCALGRSPIRLGAPPPEEEEKDEDFSMRGEEGRSTDG